MLPASLSNPSRMFPRAWRSFPAVLAGPAIDGALRHGGPAPYRDPRLLKRNGSRSPGRRLQRRRLPQASPTLWNRPQRRAPLRQDNIRSGSSPNSRGHLLYIKPSFSLGFFLTFTLCRPGGTKVSWCVVVWVQTFDGASYRFQVFEWTFAVRELGTMFPQRQYRFEALLVGQLLFSARCAFSFGNQMGDIMCHPTAERVPRAL
jgi:hypothetical protein